MKFIKKREKKISKEEFAPHPEDALHDENNKVTGALSTDLDENIERLDILFKDCNDLVKRKFPMGTQQRTNMYIAYIDLMVDRKTIEMSVLDQLILGIRDVPPSAPELKQSLYESMRDGGLATADIKEVDTMDEVTLAILSGDTVLFMDGYAKVIIIATKGWPNRGIQAPETEVVVQGPKEAFSESLRMNTVLIRRRIRDTKLKVKQLQIGTRSRTDIALVYMEDIVRPSILEELEKRLHSIEIDAILESGYIQQLIEDDWNSPFPQIQTTERPDKTASSILEGRIAIVVDNTPFVLIAPAVFASFFQAAEDYYQRWHVMSFVRLIRYVAGFFAAALPGLYIALTTFHPAMIPTPLALAMAGAREAVPFPAVIEVVIMELAFELLREAGIRLPAPIGSTIGIVGGLIIGQAAVEAGIVSPIIVIIVAVTAISSFAIPAISMTNGFRIMKYIIILCSAFLGLYGFWLGVLVLLIHLVSLKSFNIPYMYPYVSCNLNGYNDLKDSIIRVPTFLINKRPLFARADQRIRMKSSPKKK